MKAKSLRSKVLFLAAVPMICFIAAAGFILKINYDMYAEASDVHNKFGVVAAASAVVHESQKERGKTAGFLNGGIDLSAVRQQREQTNKQIISLKDRLESSTYTSAEKDRIISFLDRYKPLRAIVDSKGISTKDAIKLYTAIIADLLNLELDLARTTTLSDAATELKSLRIFEDAKESGGKLRANITSILANDRALSDAKFDAIITLRSGVNENLNSSGLILTEEISESIESFKASSAWAEVNAVFNKVLLKANVGNYRGNPSEFFATITVALDKIAAIKHLAENHLLETLQKLESQALFQLAYVSIATLLLLILIFVLIFIVTRNINKNIFEVITALRHNVAEILGSSEEMAQTSSRLTTASSSQAASLQETVSAIDEISGMVQNNASSAKSSAVASAASEQAANSGKERVIDMKKSIEEIANNNDEIMRELNRNNNEVAKIIEVISEISEKTKVINDIVFQTKLLSFNASVEAARAGEHGQGFAVVAEEVGNLASMSGKASLEITTILGESTKQVNEIVESSKKSIASLMTMSRDKVKNGSEIADNCQRSLEEIMRNVVSVNEMVSEISTASQEQSIGVQEVTSAMRQLDEVGHENNSSAQKSSDIAETLKVHSQNLKGSVDSLLNLVEGHNRVEEDEEGPQSASYELSVEAA